MKNLFLNSFGTKKNSSVTLSGNKDSTKRRMDEATFRNASEEFQIINRSLSLDGSESVKILCAHLTFMGDNGLPEEPIVLKKGYTPEDYDRFLSEIDREYQDNFHQYYMLYGHIWLDDGTWYGREREDVELGFGEFWRHVVYPTILPECEGSLTKSAEKKD